MSNYQLQWLLLFLIYHTICLFFSTNRTEKKNVYLNQILIFRQKRPRSATIPATSCSLEILPGALRKVKTYLRSTMAQDRFSVLGILNIEYR